jgi:hypothetical protein
VRKRERMGLHGRSAVELEHAAEAPPVCGSARYLKALRTRSSDGFDARSRGLSTLNSSIFGQMNQEDLLERLQERLDLLPSYDRDRILRRLAGYMVNLSPIGHEHALMQADLEANELLCAASANAQINSYWETSHGFEMSTAPNYWMYHWSSNTHGTLFRRRDSAYDA